MWTLSGRVWMKHIIKTGKTPLRRVYPSLIRKETYPNVRVVRKILGIFPIFHATPSNRTTHPSLVDEHTRRTVCSFANPESRNKAVFENSAKLSRKSGNSSSGGRFGTERNNSYNFLVHPPPPVGGHLVASSCPSATPTSDNAQVRRQREQRTRTEKTYDIRFARLRGWPQVEIFQIIFIQTVLYSISLLSLSSKRFVRSQ